MTTYCLKKKKMNRFLKYKGKWMMIRKKRTGICQLCNAGKGRGKDAKQIQTQTQFHQIIESELALSCQIFSNLVSQYLQNFKCSGCELIVII
jgi:hypothetical protein